MSGRKESIASMGPENMIRPMDSMLSLHPPAFFSLSLLDSISSKCFHHRNPISHQNHLNHHNHDLGQTQAIYQISCGLDVNFIITIIIDDDRAHD